MDSEKLFSNPSATTLTWHHLFGDSSVPADNHQHNINSWEDHTMTTNHFDSSALSSLVSSPSSNPATENVVIRELIGRLGSICNNNNNNNTRVGGDISPTYHSANTSSYTTPLNSPPKLNLSIPAPWRHSSLGGNRNNYPQFNGNGKLSRVSSSQSLVAAASGYSDSPMQEGMLFEIDTGEMGSPPSREESSASDRIATSGKEGMKGGATGENSVRKRKAAPKGKGKPALTVNPPTKVAGEEDLSPKRCKPTDTKNGDEREAAIKKKAANKKQGKESNVNPQEPPKDYIHVRARRGQATDSHSLAERVRREKISERMKFLQDLVPGCNKVTGKAVMLDEIINYVQALQRQVEFLSIKLATVNPQLDFNVENLIPKEMNQAHGPMTPHSVYQLDPTSTAFSYAHQNQGTPLRSAAANRLHAQYSANPLDSGLRQALSMQMPQIDGFGDATSQIGTFWEDDLHTVVQMGFSQNQDGGFSSPSLHGSLSSAHMKVEL